MIRNMGRIRKRAAKIATVAMMASMMATALNSCTKEPISGGGSPTDGARLEIHFTFPKGEQSQAFNARAFDGGASSARAFDGGASSARAFDGGADVCQSRTLARATGAARVDSSAQGLTFWTSGSSTAGRNAYNFATRATDADQVLRDESRIDRMVVLVFNEDGTQLESVVSSDFTPLGAPADQPLWSQDDPTIVVWPLPNPKENKKIFAIANWDKTQFDKSTYTEKDLRAEISKIDAVEDINGTKAYPIMMSGLAVFNASQSPAVTIDLYRAMVKVDVSFKTTAATQSKLPNIEWLKDKAQIMVANVNNSSYVMDRLWPDGIPSGTEPKPDFPKGGALITSGFIRVEDLVPGAIGPSQAHQWSQKLYIYEHDLFGAPDISSAESRKDVVSVLVQLPYSNRITGIEQYDNYYQVELVNTGAPKNQCRLVRNTIYALNINIKGIGLPFTDLIPNVNVEDGMSIVPWERSDIDVDNTPKYFNISRNRLEFQVIDSELKASIATDIKGWKLVDQSGATIFSYAEGRTAPVTLRSSNRTYTIRGSESSATIIVSRGTGDVRDELKFVAQNIRVPFSVASNSGIILNEYLVKDFTANNVNYKGWPADKLPPRGLQVAKTGNVLPSGQALSDDTMAPWSTEYINTGVNALACGMGKGNTAELLKLDPAKYPAVNLCRALGSEWYLPSRDELLLIYANKGLLSSDYSFYASGYWSATQVSGNNYVAWTVYFYNGNTYSNYKTSNGRVRCVRDI